MVCDSGINKLHTTACSLFPGVDGEQDHLGLELLQTLRVQLQGLQAFVPEARR